MGAIAFAAPILPGKTESARRWGSEIRGARHKEYGDYRKRYGITKEFAGIQQTPQGELFVGYFETADVNKANHRASDASRYAGLIQPAGFEQVA